MIELVILIVLLVVLLLLWLPTMFSWRGKARDISCSGNLKQCVNALLVYGDNNDDFLCTYGNEYSGWYRQPGVAEELGFKLSKAGRSPITERPVTVIAGGNVGPVLYRCIESLPDGQKLRITRQIYLNPPESDFELLRGKNVEIWSNSPVCLENDGKSGFHYTQHAGESYGHYYFDVLKSVLDYEP